MKHKVDRHSAYVMDTSSKTRNTISVLNSSTVAETGSRPNSTVIVVEKNRLFRDCLLQRIRDMTGFAIRGTATLEECLWLAQDEKPFLVLIGVPSGLDPDECASFVGKAARLLPDTPILFLSDHEHASFELASRDPQTVGYVSTSKPLDVAISAIRFVHAGGALPDVSLPSLAPDKSAIAAKSAPNKLVSMFTARQAAVVEALRTGKSNKVIAYELKMKESTVKVHVRNIMKKLNARNRTEVSYVAAKLEAGSALPGRFRCIPELSDIRIPQKLLQS